MGQPCYSINSSNLGGHASKAGVDNSLVFFLDLSGLGELSDKKYWYDPEGQYEFESLVLGDSSPDDARREPTIYIGTKTRFTEYKTGVFKMSSLKGTSGSERFMALPYDIRKCEQESFEECNNNRFMEKVQEDCGCLPWYLTSVHKSKVIKLYFQMFDSF